jgi:hypothetical protein
LGRTKPSHVLSLGDIEISPASTQPHPAPAPRPPAPASLFAQKKERKKEKKEKKALTRSITDIYPQIQNTDKTNLHPTNPTRP